ncbi:MAG: hypothetical protein Q9200_003141 [Gallowayella weberi]
MPAKATNRIDVHHHFLPPGYAEVLQKQSDPSGWESPKWDLNISNDFMAAQGIKTVIFSVSAPGVSFMTPSQGVQVARECNQYGAHLRDSDPSRFGFFAMVPDPSHDMEAALSEIRYSFEVLQADGVCLLTRYGEHNLYLGHKEYLPLWQELSSRKAVVFVHPNHAADTQLVNPALPSPVVDYTHETTRFALDMITSNMLATHPNCKIILSHAGGTIPWIALRAASAIPGLLDHHNMSPKTSAQIMSELKGFYFDLALGSSDLTLPFMIKFAGVGNLLFGSDFPYPTMETMELFTENLNEYQGEMSEEDAFAVNRGNAEELFPRLKHN